MRNAQLADARPASPADPVTVALAVAPAIFARAASVDAPDVGRPGFPLLDIAALAEAGLLAAPLASDDGGSALGVDPASADAARRVLGIIGGASLTVGRLFEGHLNAVKLAAQYGAPSTTAILRDEVAAGRISGVWNAERGGGVVARAVPGGWRLHGRKVYCSGAGSVRRAVVTAVPVAAAGADSGPPLMLLPDLFESGVHVDLMPWRATGMRGTVSGTVTFDEAFVPDAAVIGQPGDYYRAPWFCGGAWRVLAVQAGAMERLMALHADGVRANGRAGEPVVRARFADAAAAHESARLLVREASLRVEQQALNSPEAGQAAEAFVHLARSQFDALARRCIGAARDNLGLGSHIAPHPAERVIRDLETYLRQPNLDGSRDIAAAWLIDHGGVFETGGVSSAGWSSDAGAVTA